MSDRDDDRLCVRPGAPQRQGDAFINQVLRQARKAGTKAWQATGTGRQPGARLGRGHVAARFAGQGLGLRSRRVVVKARLVNLARAGPRSITTHLRYIEREGVDREGGAGQAYGPTADAADLKTFTKGCAEDRHQFRFIVSLEDAEQIGDLRTYTRHLMARVEVDLGTHLEWVAVDHWNTDNPHTHVVLRGKDGTGKDLVIARDYIAAGMRRRASELATDWLGPRTDLEIRRAMQREVDQERWTGLDRILQVEAVDGLVGSETLAKLGLQSRRQALIGRLQCLRRLGLATERPPGTWQVHSDAEGTLRAMGERGDIIRTMQRAMAVRQRELAVFQPGEGGGAIAGRVAGKGLADELHEKGYLIVDGIDGKAHYVALPSGSELAQYPIGAIVEVKNAADVRTADRNIATLAVDGLYRTDHHLAIAQGRSTARSDPRQVVAAHVRRLEALRRAGIVERMADGIWRVPADLPERGRIHDRQRVGGGVVVDLKSHLSIDGQARVIGATWLDQQLIVGGKGVGNLGFGIEVKEALRQRVDFLIEQGLAERHGPHTILAPDLLPTLRGRELAKAAQEIAAETGLKHRPVAGGQRASGIYRRSLVLASGRYALLEDGMAFSLVPWKPVIEQRLGQKLAATVRGDDASWVLARQRGLAIG